MDGTCELERRLIAEQPGLEVKADENGRTVIRGYAAVFESESQDLGGFVEIVERGAFDEVMGSSPDVFGKYNHERVIGRTSSGTMRLMVDERGLRYEIDPPRAAADVVELIERGDVRGSSFAFRSRPADETWSRDNNGRMIRRIKKFSFLGDAGPVDTPAYLATETYVSKRALEMAQAETRAAADSLEVGDFVSWEFSNGKSQGKITRIVTGGQIEVPDSSFTINGTPDDPAVLIRIYDEEDGGWEPTDRLVGHRATTLTKIDPLPEPSDDEDERAVSMRPTSGMASAARRGLKLHEEGKSGDGLKPETVARANRLAKREEMNADWIREMNAWFSRHESASKSPGWDTPGEEKPGFVAWLLWGGNAAKNWSARKVKELEGERDLPEIDEERDIEEEPRITVKVSVDTTDFIGKIAGLKSALLRTHLHAK
jgi:HK97 family phage prohead protease